MRKSEKVGGKVVRDAVESPIAEKGSVLSLDVMAMKQENNAALDFIKRGTFLTKVRSVGRRYQRHFFVDSAGLTLRYSDSRKNQCMRSCRRNEDQSKILLHQVVEVRDGVQPGSVLYPFRVGLRQDAVPCFSIVVGEDMQTLDLIAPDNAAKNLWVQGLRCLISQNDDKSPAHQELTWLKEKFQEADVNQDDSLEINEIIKLMQSLNVSPIDTERVAELCKATSLNKSEFIEFYKKLTRRKEIEDLYGIYANDKNHFIGPAQLIDFFKREQNENLNVKDAERLIKDHEPCPSLKKRGLLSNVGFHELFASQIMSVRKPLSRTVYHDMTQPLSHYFINSSHNTYLEGNQINSYSSVQQYIRVLTHRCRCVELDVWDGDRGEPIIYHGYTWTSKISFRDVLEGIKEHAFKKSQYPLILSIENHCSVKQQEVMAELLCQTFGDQLLTKPLEQGCENLPSPEALKNKVIIKGKKLPADVVDGLDDAASVSEDDEAADIPDERVQNEVVKKAATEKKHRLASKLSDCVIICQSSSFKSFATSAASQTFVNISSLDEDTASKLSATAAKEFVKHNAWQLTRIYPAGRRTTSSNYNPIPMWNVGCQVVALNFQTRDDPLLLNYGRFEDNGACGYVLKPEFMRTKSTTFNCYESRPGVASRLLTVRVISGFVLPKKSGDHISSILDPYIRVEIFGVAADCTSHQTKHILNNGFHPEWNETLPKFTVTCPELALVMFRVMDKESQKDVMVAQYCLPFNCIQPGYRMIALRDVRGNVVGATSLFVHITIESLK